MTKNLTPPSEDATASEWHEFWTNLSEQKSKLSADLRKWKSLEAGTVSECEKQELKVQELQKQHDDLHLLESAIYTLEQPGTLDTAQTSNTSVTVRHVNSEQKGRRVNVLSAVIKLAQKMAVDPNDYHSVWGALTDLADATPAPPPLHAYKPGQGIMYENEEGGFSYLTKNALRNRIQRYIQSAQ